jgi:hypothetical protein
MQMAVLLLGWISVVAVVDIGVTRPWKSPAARAPLPIALGVVVAAWVLTTGALAYADSLTEGLWTGATIAIAFVPAKAIVLSLLVYAAGRTVLTARATPAPLVQRWGLPAILAGLVLYALASDVAAMHNGALERAARDPALSADAVTALVQRIHAGAAAQGELEEFLGNPLCPADLLAEYAAKPDVRWRIAVARNQSLDAALIEKLATDPDEQVRYYMAFNRNLPPALVSRLAADSSQMVRDAAQRRAQD